MTRREQIEKLKAQIEYLESRLSAYEAQPAADACPAWAQGLSRQMLDVVNLLVRAYPRALSDEYLDDNISHYDAVVDRGEGVVKTIVCRLRKRLGKEVIATEWGLGYRATPQLVERVRAAA